jgi:hypothetical protein
MGALKVDGNTNASHIMFNPDEASTTPTTSAISGDIVAKSFQPQFPR